ncbi:MAG: hypothetical protein OEY22_03650 [Candidatus Bathyarchaeota archaeon]|nr:hypothetical protein [Candidatus Bathyarchaeota archaeon]MDH5787862.1 hypothetical protein [Candidatus Bathyarchaeota archaeon]
MAGSTIDHLISVTVFLGAILLFISLFNQTLQTAILYQRHRNLATKCSDLLDNMLLNPGIPVNWGRSNCTPTGFGVQDPEFTQYKLSPFSLMRLRSSYGQPVYYPKTGSYYSNITMGFGNFLLVSFTQAINYSTVAKLLGVNNTYGFQLTITPIITVSVKEVQSKNPLKISVEVTGTGFPLANAAISYCFLTVALAEGGGEYPSYKTEYGTTYADDKGSVVLEFAEVDDDGISYAFIAYAHLSGLIGVGYHERVNSDKQYIIPFIDNLEERKVLIAHSYDVQYFGPPVAELSYNATFVLLTEDFTLREMPMDNDTGKVGKVNYGEGKPYKVVTIPTYNPGILIITYRKSAVEGGVILMPWGISSMAFPVTFGEDTSGKEWVATDLRQVIVNRVAYQAKLALWSLESYPVVG